MLFLVKQQLYDDILIEHLLKNFPYLWFIEKCLNETGISSLCLFWHLEKKEEQITLFTYVHFRSTFTIHNFTYQVIYFISEAVVS